MLQKYVADSRLVWNTLTNLSKNLDCLAPIQDLTTQNQTVAFALITFAYTIKQITHLELIDAFICL
ncbi:MAG TPA: hypothetical protein VMD05_01255 [Candidatus Nanoarchaeia archaeon]|nr:hypothetical protein [Candidatus Nanoarchaeia archaeon]